MRERLLHGVGNGARRACAAWLRRSAGAAVGWRHAAEQPRDFGVAALAGEVAGGLVVIGLEAGVGAFGQQQLSPRPLASCRSWRRASAANSRGCSGRSRRRRARAAARRSPRSRPCRRCRARVSLRLVRARASAPCVEQQPDGVRIAVSWRRASAPSRPRRSSRPRRALASIEQPHRLDVAARRPRPSAASAPLASAMFGSAPRSSSSRSTAMPLPSDGA